MSVNKKTCVYLGIGNMGFPVFKATAPFFLELWNVVVIDKSVDRLRQAQSLGDVKVMDSLPEEIDILFLGVRPQDLPNIALEHSSPTLIISMMAGVSCSEIQQYSSKSSVVRCMPNTPCEYGAGITPIYYDGMADHNYTAFIAAAQNLGELFFVEKEHLIDAATGISGGGPAYIMVIADAMIKASEELGFSYAEAKRLVSKTLEGSGKMLEMSSKLPSTLAQDVMTPNGTTEQGVNELKKQKVDEALYSALMKASHKAEDMASPENR
ncbi:pyrroline-5-carboxylate reductase [Marinomonas sp. C2222]|uniref:Pyrroline-5-carboxylate reductase n=1 Tax=Marinomonas sargassi TaxID=2984494 RepID=A0ABT2YTM9_9GAMM|nr:pyrroline-5-carboxylate reductase [Marinomonas sargassi]MCV2403252.1 pyrroline-5-carboxylate reductase [Marinomonas sargassi]